jgi:hypothetical protein
MADRYINGVLHRAEKVFRGACTRCGHETGCGWRVTEVLANTPVNKQVALYCYDCTGNHWARAFRLYREVMDAQNGGAA